jgi:5-formyltetrahydrofolate cyclo-ligase
MPDTPDSATRQDKAALRRALRRARDAVSEHARRVAAGRVMRLGLRARLLRRGKRVGFYIPAKGELDILPLLNRALWMGVECYLPIVPPRRWRRLWFGRMGAGAHWTLNRYAIPEYGARRRRVRALALDTLFLPMLGFDARGYRMGMGGGYYDASLAYLARHHAWRRPRLIGVAFETQRCASLPNDPWDVPLDAALTDAGLTRFRRAR